MRHLIVPALVAAALAGSAYKIAAYAAPGAMEAAHEEGAAFLLDAKLAGIHAALRLSADQDKYWPPFEAAVREAEQARQEMRRAMRQEREADPRPSPVAMMNLMSDDLAKASSELKKVADAAKPLFDSLDDSQKRHFGPLVHMLREGGPGPEGPGHGPKPL